MLQQGQSLKSPRCSVKETHHRETALLYDPIYMGDPEPAEPGRRKAD